MKMLLENQKHTDMELLSFLSADQLIIAIAAASCRMMMNLSDKPVNQQTNQFHTFRP